MPKLIAENLTREEFESKKSKGAAEKGGEDEEAEEPSAKEEETPPAAAFGELWRFASAKDREEARKAAAHAQQQMAETARLNIGLEEFLPDDLTDCGLLRSRRLALPLPLSALHVSDR